LEVAANLPPSPDPGFLKLNDAYRELQKAVDACRSKQFQSKISDEAQRVKALLDEFEKQVTKEREDALQ
jgi:hypothetical protein